MDKLQEAAVKYSELFNRDFFYTLETGVTIQVYFSPAHFHHLMGLQKLRDVANVTISPRNTSAYIFRNIIRGTITLSDIQKSEHFDKIELRLRHFGQINRLIEFQRIIVDFNPSLLTKTVIEKADYVLFKRSNDNMYLNLFLMSNTTNKNKQIPLTFLPDKTDYYTCRQKIINIVSMSEVCRTTKKNRKPK